MWNVKQLKTFTGVIVVFAMTMMMFTAPAGAQVEEIEDSKITAAVENDLLVSDKVNSQLVDVETVDGIVTLSGSVDNILAKDTAERIAQNVKGVRSVVNNVDVKPVIRSDDQIENDVEDALLTDPATESWEIEADVKNGVVTLTGKVESWAEKQIAATVSKNVKGVKQIDNQIDIQYKTKRSDLEIKQEIQRRLEFNTLIDEGLIDISVEDGAVKLTGAVGSAAEKRRAYNDSWVAGVKSVDDSELQVKWWAKDEMQRKSRYPDVADEEIRKAIEDALLYDPRVLSFKPKVEVDNGIVTLTGSVDGLRAKNAAEQDAKNTVGVFRVKNKLKVRPDMILEDEEISDEVSGALRLDPIVEKYDIKVTTVNGKVYLNGRVDSFYEKARAEDVASRQPGVIEVQNNLIVDYVWEPKPDWAIKEDVESEFAWSLMVDGGDIDVSVENGHVTLTGEVDAWSESQSAVKNAFEAGARSVDNELIIQYAPYTSSYYDAPYYRPYYYDYWY